MKSMRLEIIFTTLALSMALCVSFAFAHMASAATMELSSVESSNRIYELQAKVAYLTAFVEALRGGERSPAPTYVTTLNNSEVTLIGTVARDPQPDTVEVCGPMNKGVIDWGDETSSPLAGLGCSGDVHTFLTAHQYDESGNYTITVSDLSDRVKTHVVAVKVME